MNFLPVQPFLNTPSQTIHFAGGQSMTEYDPEYKLTFSSSWLVRQFVEAFLDASVTDIMDLESLDNVE